MSQTSLPSSSAILQLCKKNQWNAVLSVLDSLESRRVSNASETSDRIMSNEITVESIINHLSTDHDVRTGNTIGHFAAAANQVSVLATLLRLGVDLRKSNFSNRSPMQEARSKENQEALEFILDNMYSPVERLFYGDDGFENMIEVFTRFPEAINDPLECYNNMTWACLCVEEARLKELKWLYDHGANFQATDECGNTLLHMIPIPFAEEFEEEYDSGTSDGRRSSESSSISDEEKPLQIRTGKKTSLSGKKEMAGRRDLKRNKNRSRRRSTEEVSLVEDLNNKTQAEDKIVSIDVEKASNSMTFKTIVNNEVEDEVLDVLGPLTDFSHEEVNVFRVLSYLLSINEIQVNQVNYGGSTAAHVIAERGTLNPTVTWRALRLLKHCGADFNLQDDDGANVAMILAGSCGDGPWLTWCLMDSDSGGGGCDPNVTDVKGRRVEDHIVTAMLETFDSELDIDEEFEEFDEEEKKI